MSQTGLKIGDYVTLRTPKFDSFLGAEGILNDGLVVSNRVNEFDDNIFCVHLQRQYSAAKELEHFLETYQIDEFDDEQDENTKQYMQALQRGNLNEISLNDAYLKAKTGQPVNFGDVIQLFHVKSRKYLRSNPKQLATSERENSRVSLNISGNQYSWLKFMPRSRIDHEGDRIIANTEVFVTIAELNNEYIHVSDAAPKEGSDREVNSSLERTAWRLGIYQNCTDAQGNVLLASQLVYIYDPETNSNISIASHNPETPNDDAASKRMADDDAASKNDAGEDKQEVADGADGAGGADGDGSVTLLVKDDQASPLLGEGLPTDDYFHDFGDIVTKANAEGREDVVSLWLIESKSFINGGPFAWKTEQVRFRNLVTGRYLMVVQKVHTEEGLDGPSHSEFFLTTTADPFSNRGTVFNAMEQTGSNNLLTGSKAVTLSCNGAYLERGPEIENDVFSMKLTEDKSAALSLLINVYVPLSELGLSEDVARSPEPLDVHCGLAAKKHLQRYLELTVVPQSSGISTIWPTAGKAEMAFYELVTTQVMIFSQGFDISNIHATLGIDKSDQTLRLRRQYLLGDLGVLDIVIRLIELLIPITEKMSSGKMTDAEVVMTEMGSAVLTKCLQIIYYCVLDNTEIQIYVATHLKILLSHLKSQPYAGKCVTEMLSKNIELQETKIGEPEISIFVASLRSSTMISMYLNLLQCCCSCEGHGVDGNQCAVATLLFEGAEDVLIFLKVDDTKRIKGLEWDYEGNSVYIPKSREKTVMDSICGSALLTDGLPTLYLTWQNENKDWLPKTLFGRDLVPFEEVFSIAGFTKDAKANKVVQRKQAVANYFINEMFLGAEMCMDRNYVAMHKLDPYFTFGALVTILKMDVIEDVKAGAVRLLLCLHVDRDPQAETKIPCLTRIWSTIQKHDVPQLPNVEPSRRNSYVLIQQLIAEHLDSMVGKKWQRYSKYMLQMLLALIKFNFYGSLERMKQVIKPIIDAIDRRSLQEQPLMKRAETRIHRSDLSTSPSNANLDNEDSHTGEEKLEREEIAPWQKPVLDFFESLPVMCFILTLVLAAVSSTIYQVVAAVDDPMGSPLYIWGLVVTIVFIIDYSTRFYCSVWLYGQPMKFVTNAFNVIDALVILLDIVFLALPPTNGGSLTKTLRLIRLVRLLRVLRAAKVISAVAQMVTKKQKPWQMPTRYLKCSVDELSTIGQSLDVLLFIQSVIDDRNLSLLLRYFNEWSSGRDKRSPEELFDRVIVESAELTLGVGDFDIFMDIVMYVDISLMQNALDVIMAHHSSRSTLLKNAGHVQLLVSHKRELQFQRIAALLQELERNAETHELWGELETDDHHVSNEKTKEILLELTAVARTRCFVLEVGEDFLPDKEIQNLYRNLGCFTICFKMLGLLDSVEMDENCELSEVALNTRELCLLTNNLLYWFFLNNPLNQELGFSELDFFLDTLDSEIKSHLVLRAIFRNNENLMNIVPLTHVNGMGEKIEEKKSHHYLSLLASITNVGDKNIIKNQFEIVRRLTGPERFDKVVWGFVPITHPEYSLKRDLMAAVGKEAQDVDMDNISPLLAYHLCLLQTLSNCTIGRLNITSVEAKIQSIFSMTDIIAGIMDPDAILLTKLIMADFLLNCMIDVEMPIPGLCQSASMWRLLESFISTLEYARDEVRIIEKVGWESPLVSRHKIEYILTCTMILYHFFAKNYDSTKVKGGDGVSGPDTVSLSMSYINSIIVNLFRLTKDVYDLDSPRLSVAHKAGIYDAMIAMNKSALQPIVAGVIEATHLDRNDGEEEDVDEDTIYEKKIHSSFGEFLDALNSSEDLQAKVQSESLHFIDAIEGLPTIDDTVVVSDLRYEAFMAKLVRHVYDNFTFINGEKKLNARCTKTSIWMIKAFRTMIENKMGMTIYERDDDGGEEQDEAAAPVVKILNESGATGLCLDLIANGIDETLQNEAIKLLVGMLFKEGGARDIQSWTNNYLMKGNSVLFFKQVCLTIRKLAAWHDWHGIIVLEEGKDPEPPEEILIIRFLQLLSEGHFLPNQDMMREQPNNNVTHNILYELVAYLNSLSRYPCRTSTESAIRVAATILEVIQGPSVGNQEYIALNTELLETLNRLMHATVINDCVEEEEIELKKIVLDIFSGLLEGQGAKSAVVQRLLSVIHLDVVSMLAKPYEAVEQEEDAPAVEQPSEELLSLKVESMVLLQMLFDFKPSLREELKMSEEDIKSDSTVSLEISWDGVLNRRFFHVPDVSSLLPKSSKDNLVQNVDRSNNENKLIDFLARAHDLYREVKHQEKLVALKLSGIFGRQNQDILSTTAFALAILINALLLSFFDTDPNSGLPILPSDAKSVINALNILEVFVAAAAVINNFVVRSPVIAWSLAENGSSQMEVILYTALDGMTIYYLWFLLFALLGAAYDTMYLPFLLLDIVVKNPTTRDILNSVIQPRQQLGVAFILGIFLIYIFSFFLFAYEPLAPQDLNNFVSLSGTGAQLADCNTLWGCFKFAFVYGFRQGGGIGDVIQHDIGDMAMMHIIFFLFVTTAMLNIIFGIIIDTFSKLRSEKGKRFQDTTEVCFICGISKQTFDRDANSPDGFKDHVRKDHNMWAYLNFIFFVWEQDKDDDDGLEYYVRHKIEDNEITWFPINKAMRLEQGDTDHEIMRQGMLSELAIAEGAIFERIQAMQTDIDVILEKFSSCLNNVDLRGGKTIKQGISDHLKRIDHLAENEAVVETAAAAVEAKEPLEGDGDEEGLPGDDEDGSSYRGDPKLL